MAAIKAAARHALAGTLSGGQKRRLSAAIALIGGSQVVPHCRWRWVMG